MCNCVKNESEVNNYQNGYENSGKYSYWQVNIYESKIQPLQFFIWQIF